MNVSLFDDGAGTALARCGELKFRAKTRTQSAELSNLLVRTQSTSRPTHHTRDDDWEYAVG